MMVGFNSTETIFQGTYTHYNSSNGQEYRDPNLVISVDDLNLDTTVIKKGLCNGTFPLCTHRNCRSLLLDTQILLCQHDSEINSQSTINTTLLAVDANDFKNDAF
jgi:hypothetical protein